MERECATETDCDALSKLTERQVWTVFGVGLAAEDRRIQGGPCGKREICRAALREECLRQGTVRSEGHATVKCTDMQSKGLQC